MPDYIDEYFSHYLHLHINIDIDISHFHYID